MYNTDSNAQLHIYMYTTLYHASIISDIFGILEHQINEAVAPALSATVDPLPLIVSTVDALPCEAEVTTSLVSLNIIFLRYLIYDTSRVSSRDRERRVIKIKD